MFAESCALIAFAVSTLQLQEMELHGAAHQRETKARLVA